MNRIIITMASEGDDNNNKQNDDSKLPAKPATAAAAAGSSLSRMPSITAAGGPTWFKSLDWFKSTDSATGILRDEVFKSDVSFDIAVMEAATASGVVTAFPPPGAAISRNQSTNSTGSQDSWLRKMLTSATALPPPPPAAAGVAALPLARNTSTSSQSSIMQKVYDASKSAIAKLCTSGDWAPTDLTLHEPVNVADVFKTSNENNKTMFFADVASMMYDCQQEQEQQQQPQPHEELAAALKIAHAVPTTARHARPAAAAGSRGSSRTAASASATNCYADFMKEMQAACAPATTTSSTLIPPPRASSEARTTAASGLKNPPPVTVSSSGAAAVAAVLSEQQNKKASRKRKQSDDDDDDNFIYVEPTDKDVLMGRGGRTNNHPGNKEYLRVKDQMQKRYMEASKQDKTPISQELVDMVHAWGGRFLQLAGNNNNQWYEVDAVTARKKCSQTLREINTPEVRKAKRSKYCKA